MADVKVAYLPEQNKDIERVLRNERGKLLNFIRARIPQDEDAEDVLQDVFYQFIQSYRLMQPIEKVSSWLFTVARNKIADLFRKKKPVNFSKLEVRRDDDDESPSFIDLLPTKEDGPEGEYIRELAMEIMDEALEELPEEQRQAFVWHELEGMSFKEMSEMSGETVNTWLSRKRYAVLHLRERLGVVYREITES